MYYHEAPGAAIKAVIQLNWECLTWAGKLSRKGADAQGTASPAHMQLIAHNLAFFTVATTELSDKSSFVSSDIPTTDAVRIRHKLKNLT